MKVLHVIDALGLGGGAEQALAVMLPLLREREIDSSVACLIPRVGGIQERVQAEGFAIEVLGATSLPGRVKALRSKLAEESPDLVHATLFNASLVARLAVVGRREPLINSLVNTSYDPIRVQQLGLSRWKLGLMAQVDGFTARRSVDRVHAITQAVATEATDVLKVRSGAVEVIPRGRSAKFLRVMSAAERSKVRSDLGLAQSTPLVISVGRQDFQKNQSGLVRAFAQVSERRPDAVLILVGREGDATGELRQAIADSGVGHRIHELGHREDATSLLAAADVFAFPSHYEGLGSVLIEAMAVGVPIVGSDAPAVAEVLGGGRYGVVTPRGDAGAIADALLGLLDDGGRRAELADRGRERFESYYELELVADATASMYRSVAGR